jgi:ERCC4-type nuclease
MIYIDNREVPSDLPFLFDSLNLKYILAQLTLTDVQVIGYPIKIDGTYGSMIYFVLERKDGEDFVNSLFSGHLASQLYRMSTAYKHSAIVIEGSLSSITDLSNEKRNAVLSAISGTFLKHSNDGEQGSISLIMVDTLLDFATIVKYTQEKLLEPLFRVDPLTPPDISDKKDPMRGQVRSLLSIKGLGEDNARQLLAKKGSLRDIATSVPEELVGDGIGMTTAKKVVEHFNKKNTLPTS